MRTAVIVIGMLVLAGMFVGGLILVFQGTQEVIRRHRFDAASPCRNSTSHDCRASIPVVVKPAGGDSLLITGPGVREHVDVDVSDLVFSPTEATAQVWDRDVVAFTVSSGHKVSTDRLPTYVHGVAYVLTGLAIAAPGTLVLLGVVTLTIRRRPLSITKSAGARAECR